MSWTRRLWLGSLAAGGALALGWAVLPPRQRLVAGTLPPLPEGTRALNGWVALAPSGSVTLISPRAEMGQGIHTALAMLLAEELEVPLASVQVRSSGIDAIYNNQPVAVDGLPFHPDSTGFVKSSVQWLTAKAMREVGVMVTGGSSAVKDAWLPLRQAGASARMMLLQAAAQTWGVPVAECQARAGSVQHAATGRSQPYGELLAAASALPVPQAPALKPASAFTLLGKPQPRLEAAAKSDGSAAFTLDLKLPGQLYAQVVACPSRGGRALSANEAELRALPGVKKVLLLPPLHGASGAVAVVADSRWRALQASRALKAQWQDGPAYNTAGTYAELGKLLDADDGFAYHSQGDVAAALKGAARTISAEYRAPLLAHQQMEPNACTVQLRGQAATVWAPTQVPDVARSAVAAVLGIPKPRVFIEVPLLGGGFGRRLEVDFIAQAAAVAKDLGDGHTVQVLWSREEDLRADFYRPACVARYRAGLDASGQLVAWQASSAGQAPIANLLKRGFGLPWVGPEKTTAEGAYDQPYAWPAARVGHVMAELPVPVGSWRSVGHSHQAFFKESFLDEVAAATGTDPLELRRRLLPGPAHARALAVLNEAARRAGWGTPLAPAPDGARKARGIALHRSFGTTVAQVAEVSLSAQKQIRVHRIVAAVDCGFAVNPAHVQMQVESGIVYGLSAALYGEVVIAQGRVVPGNFHEAPVLRLAECPAIEVSVMPMPPNAEHGPEGAGEPGTPPVAPAVANALYALTGQRLRQLPLKLEPAA